MVVWRETSFSNHSIRQVSASQKGKYVLPRKIKLEYVTMRMILDKLPQPVPEPAAEGHAGLPEYQPRALFCLVLGMHEILGVQVGLHEGLDILFQALEEGVIVS